MLSTSSNRCSEHPLAFSPHSPLLIFIDTEIWTAELQNTVFTVDLQLESESFISRLDAFLVCLFSRYSNFLPQAQRCAGWKRIAHKSQSEKCTCKHLFFCFNASGYEFLYDVKRVLSTWDIDKTPSKSVKSIYSTHLNM